MAQLPEIFTPTEEDTNPFSPIPEGWYLAEVIKSEIKQKKETGGVMLSLQWKIIEGDCSSRLVFENLNYINKNATTVKIARAMLKEITDICNIDELDDTEDLHNVPMYIKVSIDPETPQWPASNRVKTHLSEDDYNEKFAV